MNNANAILERKYKTSIFIDYLFMLVILFISLFISYFLTHEKFYPSLICFFIVLPAYWFFGDKLFKNKSFGKLLMGLKIVNFTDKNRPTWKGIARRRYIEWKNYNRIYYKKKNVDIDVESGTLIVDKKYKMN